MLFYAENLVLTLLFGGNSMNIVILGANGQLGHDLIDIISADKKLNVIPVTRNELDADLDIDNIDNKLNKYRPDIIINCIATTNVDWCELNSAIAWKINADFVYRLAQFCKKHQTKLIHISTDYVFDGNKGIAYTENDLARPQNVYGLSKYSGELVIRGYLQEYFIFRVSGLFGKYGASGKGGNFITTIQRLAKEKNELNVVSDQISNPTSTLMVARSIYHFIKNRIDDYGVYNCVSKNFCSWYDFAKEILTLSDLDANKVKQVKYNDYPFKAKRPQNSVLSIDKLSQYYLMPTWQESLKEYIQVINR